MTNNEITLIEFKEVFSYLLDNNKQLEDKGLRPIAVGLEGEAGIGKTSLIEDIAKERGMTLCKVNLAQLEEIGDLVGFPIKEYEVAWIENNQVKQTRWMPENQTKNLDLRLKLTGKVRMSYAPPAWLPIEENPNGIILFLDDYTRANNMFMQASMEIINTASYISWKLPKYTSIVLSSNPDDGQFSVTSLDNAQKTRFINFNVKFHIEDWAKWAEEAYIDGRAINFELYYGNEIFKKHNNIQTVNPRSYTTFCKAISGLKDWNNPETLALILQISKGCFLNDNDNIIGNLFTSFIANKLDKLIQPKEMIELEWETLKPKMKDCVYDDGKFRPDIASILTIRFMNYVLHLFSIKGAVKENIVYDRILDIVNNDEMLFSEDLIFHLVKNLITKYPGRTNKLLMNPIIRNKVVL